MPSSYRDVDIANLKGPMGDVTPQALDAMHRAETAATEATEARDDVFERVDILGQITDAGVAWTVNNGPTTKAALEAWNLARAPFISVRDYGALGTGSGDDAPAIQAALDAARSRKGATVVFPPGTYNVGSVLTVFDQTTIHAYGALIRDTGGTGLLRNFLHDGTEYARFAGEGHIRVLGGVWDGNAYNAATGQGTVTGTINVLNFHHAESLVFRDVEVRNVSSAHALELNAIRNAVVDSCTFVGFVDNTVDKSRGFSEAIQLDAATPQSGLPLRDDTACEDIRVVNCYVGANGSRAGAPGRLVGSHTNSTVEWGVEHVNIVVSGNTINRVTDFGIRAYGWINAVITDNVVIAPGLDGIQVFTRASGLKSRVRNAVITGNIIDSPARQGIYVQGDSSYYMESVTVSNNQVYNPGEGAIRCLYVRDLIIDANLVKGGVTTTSIHCVVCSGVQVTGNIVRNSPSNGIRLSGTVASVVRGNRVVTVAGDYGIILDAYGEVESDSNIVDANYVSDCPVHGVRVTVGGGTAKITNNEIASGRATGAAIFMSDDVPRAVIANNDIRHWNYSNKFVLGNVAHVLGFSGTTTSPGENLV